MVVWFLHSSHWLNQLSQCEKKSGLEVPNHDLNDPNRWGFSVDVTMLGLGVADCVRRINQRPGMGTFSAVRSCWLLWIQALSGGQAQGTTRRKNLISFSFQNLLIQDLDLVAWFSYFVWRGFLSVTFITSVRLHPQEMTQFNTIQTRGSTRPHERETLDSFDMVWAQDDQNDILKCSQDVTTSWCPPWICGHTQLHKASKLGVPARARTFKKWNDIDSRLN